MNKCTSDAGGFRCPHCKSFSTQSVELAYKQATRTGYGGQKWRSEFADELAPPEAKDDNFLPSIVTCAAAVFAFVKLPDFLARAGIGDSEDWSAFSWKILALSCVCGWIVGLIFAIPAIRYNSFTLPPLLREWRKEMICKRCSHRWQRLGSPGLHGSDDE